MNYVSGKIVNLKVGNTEQAAKMIGRMTGGDLFHIRAAAVYPHEYKETVSLARHEWEKKASAGPVKGSRRHQRL